MRRVPWGSRAPIQRGLARRHLARFAPLLELVVSSIWSNGLARTLTGGVRWEPAPSGPISGAGQMRSAASVPGKTL